MAAVTLVAKRELRLIGFGDLVSGTRLTAFVDFNGEEAGPSDDCVDELAIVVRCSSGGST